MTYDIVPIYRKYYSISVCIFSSRWLSEFTQNGHTIKMALSRLVPLLVVVSFSFLVLYSSVRADSSSETTPEGPVVTFKDGSVRGNTVEVTPGKSVHQFLGLPFAEPPIGKLRFAAPKPSKPWTGVREATKYGPSCPQNIINMTFGNSSWESKGLGKVMLS